MSMPNKWSLQTGKSNKGIRSFLFNLSIAPFVLFNAYWCTHITNIFSITNLLLWRYMQIFRMSCCWLADFFECCSCRSEHTTCFFTKSVLWVLMQTLYLFRNFFQVSQIPLSNIYWWVLNETEGEKDLEWIR